MSNILEVPVPFFFEGLPTASDAAKGNATASSPVYISEFLASTDGLSLVKAFTQMKRRNLRQAIVTLVEKLSS